MDILIGHTNMDMDCLGSIVMGKYIYHKHIPIKSRLIHPVAQNIYNLYAKHLNFLHSRELKGKEINQIIVFDTRSYSRIKEYMELILTPWQGDMIVYDHHSADISDLPGSRIIEGNCGANTTLIAKEVKNQRIKIDPDDATIALSGIFADTGNFTHNNINASDFEIAEWLLSSGANMKLVREFLNVLNQDYQIDLFHRILNQLEYKKIHGHSIIISRIELKEQVNGLAAIVEKVFEIENPDALFVVFGFENDKNSLIISRSKKENINLYPIMKNWGGGGHNQAGAAKIKNTSSDKIYSDLYQFLHDILEPALKAEDIMTINVHTINENWSVKEASIYLEKINHIGAPVITPEGKLTGMLTLRDISKARRSEQMTAPVKSYMSKKLYACDKKATLNDIGRILRQHNIGHIPVAENEYLVGLITRTDYLEHIG